MTDDDIAALQRVSDAFDELGAALIREMRPALIAFGDAANALYAEWRRLYDAAGAPYGPSDDGMLRWLGEQVAAQQEAERMATELAWERGLAQLRERFRQRSVDDGPETGGDEALVRSVLDVFADAAPGISPADYLAAARRVIVERRVIDPAVRR